MGSHLISFLGQNYSGPTNQNLLWQSDNVYLMDNHRAALWCWQQQLDLYSQPHNILHIDRHTDALGANLEEHVCQMPDLRDLSISDYLDAKIDLGSGRTPLFRWDNYLSIHIAAFEKNLGRLISVDHGDGDDPKLESTQRPMPDELPENTQYWLGQGEVPWIVNIDIDYFYCTDYQVDNDVEDRYLPMFSDEYIDSIIFQIKNALDNGCVKVVTVCLTPSNFTPGWRECLNVSRRMFKLLGADHPQI